MCVDRVCLECVLIGYVERVCNGGMGYDKGYGRLYLAVWVLQHLFTLSLTHCHTHSHSLNRLLTFERIVGSEDHFGAISVLDDILQTIRFFLFVGVQTLYLQQKQQQ